MCYDLVIMTKFSAHVFALFSLISCMALLAACGSDSANDSPMELVATTEFDNLVRSAAVDNGRLITVESIGNEEQVALYIYEVDEGGELLETGSLTAPGDGYNPTYSTPNGIAVDDDVAYVTLTGDRNGIWMVDVADPEAPEELSFFDTPDVGQVAVSINDDVAAVATGVIGTGVNILDITDPDAVEQLTRLSHPGSSTPNIKLTGDYAYLVDASGLTVIDVSDPDAPEEAGFFENPTWAGPISGEAGSLTTSASDMPAQPDVAVAGEHVLMTTGADALEILNLDDPENIESDARIETEFASMGVDVSGDYAYTYSRGELELGEPMTDVSFVVQKIDISDASEPEVVQELDVNASIPSAWQSIVAGDEHLFVLKGTSIDVITIAG